jgi:microsomal dipeptidase-like Zn-dependent dipeptidase
MLAYDWRLTLADNDLPKVTAGLLDRGYSESDTRKILGENLLRAFKAVIG